MQTKQANLRDGVKRRVEEAKFDKQPDARRLQEKRNDWRKPLQLGFKPTSSDPSMDWENDFAGKGDACLGFEEEHKVNYVDGIREVEDPPMDLY